MWFTKIDLEAELAKGIIHYGRLFLSLAAEAGRSARGQQTGMMMDLYKGA